MNQLIRKAREGDPDAFIQLMDAHKQAMYQVARGYFSNPMDVEDMLSETVLTCWERLHTLRRPEYFKTWLTRILINNCNDLIRSRRRLVPLEEVPEPSETLSEDDLPGLLDHLDRQTRLILILHYSQGYKTREIAKMLGLPHGTVTSKLKRGRDKLAKRLAEEEVHR
ncbi:MAG: sigma-70 family RNA polymerase sigma factor [Oscillospiraceae bacterium]|nr:sigma-70 family RNA polymerase sigma factor [Oscillospiraceae bacterium]